MILAREGGTYGTLERGDNGIYGPLAAEEGRTRETLARK
jgi:hypothetical protein